MAQTGVFSELFGDLQHGRLKRLPYLGWHVILLQLMLLLSLLHGPAWHAGPTPPISASPTPSPDLWSATLATLFLALLFAQLNIAAKRLRDTGIPGWRGLLLLIMVGWACSAAGDALTAFWMTTCSMALMLTPSHAPDQGWLA